MEVYRLKHHGECLLPLGISDGTELFGYRLTGWRENDMELLDCIGKIVAVRFSNNKGGLIKVLSNYDIFNKELWLMQLNPQVVKCIPLDIVEDILLVQKANI